MKRLFWQILLVAGFATGLLASAWGGQPSDKRAGAASQPTTVSTVRLSVLIRNLRNVLGQDRIAPIRTGKTRYDWSWLASRYDEDRNGAVTREEFPGPEDMYACLDRNWDGKLTRQDFDWTENGALGRQKEATFALFKSADKNSDGRITLEEWQSSFTKEAGEKGYLNDKDLEHLIYLPLARRVEKLQEFHRRRFENRTNHLMHLIESGKLFTDGPEVEEMAPDFSLRSPDGLSKMQLSAYRQNSPVVLIFGSFT